MAAKVVWGLDIGNSALKAVKMERIGADCRIVDFDVIGISGDDDKDRSARIEAAFQTLATNHKIGNDPVFLSIPGNICLPRDFQIPATPEEKVHEMVTFEARQQIPFPLDQVEWGYERYEDPTGGIGIALIAVRKSDIQELLTLADKFKLNLRGITAAPVSLFNFVRYEFNPENTTLILDAGSKGTDFVVMNKRQIYFRTIQIAGREITRSLETKFKVQFDKAEELKINIEKSPQMDKILAVIEPTLRQLGAEVQRTIGFYKSKARGQRIGQCYLLGHTFRLPKMAEFLQMQVREAPFALVEGLQRVRLDVTINPETWNAEFPTMAVSIGLGIQGLGLSELTLNLIGKQKASEQAAQQWKFWAVGAAALVAFTAGFSFVKATGARDDAERKLNELVAASESVTKYEKAEAEAIKGLPELEKSAARYARIASDRGKIAQAIARVSSLKGANGRPLFGHENKVYLTNIYMSRAPFGSVPHLADQKDDPRNALKSSEDLAGKNSLYAPLGAEGMADPALFPFETRPSYPLLLVLSGEVESGEALAKLAQIEEALKRLPEVKKDKDGKELVRVKRDDGPTHVETLYEYDHKGAAKTPATGQPPAPAKTQSKQYAYFNIVVQWEDPNAPDIAPMPVPDEPRQTGKKKSGSK